MCGKSVCTCHISLTVLICVVLYVLTVLICIVLYVWQVSVYLPHFSYCVDMCSVICVASQCVRATFLLLC